MNYALKIPEGSDEAKFISERPSSHISKTSPSWG
jgi:hypothetical protein